ncbi:MAG: hypothetical protein LBS54_07715 [Dysgonamonadaceae bacterium]|nr:hypothetical protein [Dysgonamonadaceae bacterium]
MPAYNDNEHRHTMISDACVGVPPTLASVLLRRLRRRTSATGYGTLSLPAHDDNVRLHTSTRKTDIQCLG